MRNGCISKPGDYKINPDAHPLLGLQQSSRSGCSQNATTRNLTALMASGKLFVCAECRQCFWQLRLRHPFVCSQSFSRKHGLKRHLVSHQGIRFFCLLHAFLCVGSQPYACKQCDKRFALQGQFSSSLTTYDCSASLRDLLLLYSGADGTRAHTSWREELCVRGMFEGVQARHFAMWNTALAQCRVYVYVQPR